MPESHDYDTIERHLQVFKSLPQADQLAALFEILRFIRAEIVNVKKKQIEFEMDLVNHKKRSTGEMTTSEKIREAFDKRFDPGVWFRDKVLPYIIVAVMFAILQLSFQKP